MSRDHKPAVKGVFFDFLFGIVLIGLALFIGLPEALSLAYPIHMSSDLRPSLVLPTIGTGVVLVGLRFLVRGIVAMICHE
jgi:hypothetical protein